MHLACQNGHNELAKLLLERGSDIHALTLNKKTPLHLAAQNGSYLLVNFEIMNLKLLFEQYFSCNCSYYITSKF